MDQLKKLLSTLSMRQKIIIAAAVVLVASGLSFFVRWNHDRGFKPLFTGMSTEDASAVVQKLKESGTEYRITDNGGSVLVPEAKLDELRLQMAGAGIPKTGRIGFELFDKTNLGITDFTEHVNYRRALEGELERSIRSLTEVEQARVHVTFPKDSIFLESQQPAKASVLLHLHPGARLAPQNVVAIANLVASAVEGLTPENVSVLDTQGNLLSRERRTSLDGNEMSDAALDYKHQVEKDLVAKVQSTLEPLLGEGHFRVGLSTDCDFSTSEQSEESFDPTHSVIANSQKSEDVSNGSGVSGVPGTPSNLPRAATPRPSVAATSVAHRTENVSYQTSRVVKHVKTPQGAIKRISASVLLDQELQWQGSGKQRKRVLVPPAPEKIKAIHDVVAAVLGIVPDRGDQLVIESLPFEQTVETQNPEESPTSTAPVSKVDLKTLLKDKRVLIGAGVALLLLAGAAMFLMKRKKKPVPAAPETPTALPSPAQPPRKTKTDADRQREEEEALEVAREELQAKLQVPFKGKQTEALRIHVRDQVKKDPVVVANVLKGWLAED